MPQKPDGVVLHLHMGSTWDRSPVFAESRDDKPSYMMSPAGAEFRRSELPDERELTGHIEAGSSSNIGSNSSKTVPSKADGGEGSGLGGGSSVCVAEARELRFESRDSLAPMRVCAVSAEAGRRAL